jgi:hypothetical protein
VTVESNSANGAMLSPRPTAIETASGRFVSVDFPDPATIFLEDIAQGLAQTCRYGGHVKRFYSVAEHAVLVHDLVSLHYRDKQLALAALFHDAAEAYLGDVVAPLKYALRSGRQEGPYDRLSARMDWAIARRFGLDRKLFDVEELRTADMWALRIEAKSLTHSGGAHWRWPGELPWDGRLPRAVSWSGGLDPFTARASWMAKIDNYDIVTVAA